MSMPRTPRNTDPVFALAEVIKFHREERGWTHRSVATVCGTNIKTVEEWETGVSVPTPEQWSKLKRAVNHSLRFYAELFQAARTRTTPGTASTPVTTNLGEKMKAAKITVVPAPQENQDPDPTDVPTPLPPVMALSPVPDAEADEVEEELSNPLSLRISTALRALPEGWKTLEERRRRRDWVREEFLRDPEQPIQHVLRRAREKFGVGVKERDVAEIKEEVEEVLSAMQRINAEEKGEAAPLALPPPPPPAPRDPASDLSTAVELLLGALPNLAQLTINVDEQGNASVNYLTREVKVIETSGSLTLPKK
jgi:transcriptional regulator with XRE-family HTH domain